MVGKNYDALIERAQVTTAPTVEPSNATDVPATATEYINLPLGKKLQIPETYTADIFFKDGKLHLSANADIRIPDTESMPLARVGKTDFQLSELRLLLDELYGDTPLYWNDYPGDRAEVAELLEYYQAFFARDGKNLTSSQQTNTKKNIVQYEAMLAEMSADDLYESWSGELLQETSLVKVFEE